MGNNGAGQLGPNADPYAQDVPIEIVASNVTAVAEGNTFTLFIESDGSLWGMGENPYGQLGLGPAYVGEHNGTHVPLQIVASNVVAVATGYGHGLFIKSDGSLWGMGYNADGELGDGTYSNRYYPEQIVPRRQPIIGTVSFGRAISPPQRQRRAALPALHHPHEYECRPVVQPMDAGGDQRV